MTPVAQMKHKPRGSFQTLGVKTMKNILNKILLGVFLIASTGCLTTPPEKVLITNLSERIEIPGVSILPPQEKGWHYQRWSPTEVEFGKVVSNEKSFVMVVSLSRLTEFDTKEDFINYLSNQRQRNAGNPRYEDLINEEHFSEEKETPSLRFHTKYKDKGSLHLTKGKNYFLVNDHGIFCRHPKAYSISVNIVCSQRSLEGEERADWEKVANEFIQNTEFIDFPKE